MDDFYYKITRIENVIKEHRKIRSFVFTITTFAYRSDFSEMMLSNSYSKVKINLNSWNYFEFFDKYGDGLMISAFSYLNGLFCSDTKEGEHYEAFEFLSYLYDILEESDNLEYEQIENIHKEFKIKRGKDNG
jgi:hypothetical protein